MYTEYMTMHLWKKLRFLGTIFEYFCYEGTFFKRIYFMSWKSFDSLGQATSLRRIINKNYATKIIFINHRQQSSEATM